LVVLLAAALFNAAAAAALVPAVEPLPVILRGTGNWLDRTNAVQRLSVVLPVEGQPLVLTNLWVNGEKILAAENE
jgi:hypothetical protein